MNLWICLSFNLCPELDTYFPPLRRVYVEKGYDHNTPLTGLGFL